MGAVDCEVLRDRPTEAGASCGPRVGAGVAPQATGVQNPKLELSATIVYVAKVSEVYRDRVRGVSAEVCDVCRSEAEVSEVCRDRGVAEVSGVCRDRGVAEVSEVCRDRAVAELSDVCCDQGIGWHPNYYLVDGKSRHRSHECHFE